MLPIGIALMNYYKVLSRIPSSISLCSTINLLILYTVNLSKLIIRRKKRKPKTKQERKKWNRRNERNAIYRENRDNVVLVVLVGDKISPRDYIHCTAYSHTYTRTCRSTIYPGQEIVPGEPFTGFHREDITRRPPRRINVRS